MSVTKQIMDRRLFLAGGAALSAGLALPGCVIDRGANGITPSATKDPAGGTRGAGGVGDAGGAGKWRDMFNGNDLSGWVNVNGWNDTWRWENGMVVTTGKPICVMRTQRMYKNFELEMEWRHMLPGGNAGLFIWSDALPARGQPFTRAIEVQILDGQNTENYTSDGDVFAIHGSVMTPDRPHPDGWMRCLPSERRANASPQWNHYRVVANHGTIKLSVNGKEVSGGYDISPRKGYICLESEGSEAHFRNIRVRELASSGATAEQTATRDQGYVSMYTSADLAGWKMTPDHDVHWKSNDWRIESDGGPTLWSDPVRSAMKDWMDFDLLLDWRFIDNRFPDASPSLMVRGVEGLGVPLPPISDNAWHRGVISVHGSEARYRIDGEAERRVALDGRAVEGSIGLAPNGTRVDWANIFVR